MESEKQGLLVNEIFTTGRWLPRGRTCLGHQGRCKTLEEVEVRNMGTSSSPLGKEKESSGKEEADGRLHARQLWFGAGFQGEQGCPNAS